MSKVKITGNASGTGTLTIAAPNTNTDRTLTLPDGAGEILTDASSLPAANLTGTLPAIDGSSLTGIASSSGNHELLYDSALGPVNSLTISNVPSWATKIVISFVNVKSLATERYYLRLLKGGTNQITSLYEHWTKLIGGASVSTDSKFTDRFQLSHNHGNGRAGDITLLKTASRGWSLTGQIIDVVGDTLSVNTGYCGDTSTITGLHIWTGNGGAFSTGAISIYAEGEA